MITVIVWHNVVIDGQGRHTAMLNGYRPGDAVVRVFTYQTARAVLVGREDEAPADGAGAVLEAALCQAGGAERRHGDALVDD